MLAIFYHDVLLEEKAVHVHIHNRGEAKPKAKSAEEAKPKVDNQIQSPPIMKNPATKQLTTTNPATGKAIDLKTGLPIDPNTGDVQQMPNPNDPPPEQYPPIIVNPATGQKIFVDPVTQQPTDLKTGLPIDAATGQPTDPKETEVQAGLASIQSIQKYVLFLKLLEFKRQLEFHNFDTHINFKEYQECVNYIKILITFYETFTLDQLTTSINVVISQIDKLLGVSLKINKTQPQELV